MFEDDQEQNASSPWSRFSPCCRGLPSHSTVPGTLLQQGFHSWVDCIRLWDKKCFDPSEVLGSYTLNTSFFHLLTSSFYPWHQVSHDWSSIFHQSISVFLILLKAYRKTAMNGQKEWIHCNLFLCVCCLYRREECGSENPAAGSQ